MKNKKYLLAFNRMRQIGPRTVMKLQERWPDLEEAFRQPRHVLEKAGISSKAAGEMLQFDFAVLEEDWRWEKAQNHSILTWDDPDYPALLREIYDPPTVLYSIGDLACLHEPAVAMVGTRNPSVTGSETAKRFGFELARHKITVVSGLALGIDAQAHLGCLEARGKTVAVMATGMDLVYPSRHRSLAGKICQTGLLLTEFPLGTKPIAGHFPRRNRIISGLSLATLVVEAAIKSGSLITARLALEQNRDIFAIPSSIYNPQARGCHYLLQQGAKLVTSCDDILNELCLEKVSSAIDAPSAALAIENQNLVKCIGFETTTLDQIIVRSGLSFEKVACDLAELELQGVVKAVPGGYMRCTL